MTKKETKEVMVSMTKADNAALAIVKTNNDTYQLVLIPFNSNTLDAEKGSVLMEHHSFSEVSDQFRIEAAQRDFA